MDGRAAAPLRQVTRPNHRADAAAESDEHAAAMNQEHGARRLFRKASRLRLDRWLSLSSHCILGGGAACLCPLRALILSLFSAETDDYS